MSAPQLPAPFRPPSTAARAGSFAARVLWTVIPFGTVGLLGWVPAVHIARRKGTPASWWWLAGLVAATVGECVLVSVVPTKSHGNAETAAGAFALGYLITATVYTWRGCGPEPARRQPQQQPYAGYGAAWPSAAFGTAPPTPFPSPTLPYPVPAAAHDMAAEVQAELRELRGFLGGEDAR